MLSIVSFKNCLVYPFIIDNPDFLMDNCFKTIIRTELTSNRRAMLIRQNVMLAVNGLVNIFSFH